MISRKTSNWFAAMAAAVAVGGGAWLYLSGTHAAAHPGTDRASRRRAAVILKHISDDITKLQTALPHDSALSNAAFRKKSAPAALPILRDLVRLSGQYKKADPTGYQQNQMDFGKYQMLALMDAFGDASTRATLLRLSAAKTHGHRGLLARMALIQSGWWRRHNATAQGLLLNKMGKITAANTYSDDVAETLASLSESGAANRKIKKRAIGMLRGMQAPEMQELLMQVDPNALPAKLAAMVGKPLTVTGPLLNGKPFSTAQWKGKKVVLVDFWATWCPPCRREIPHVEKAYEQYHQHGFEIIGVSSDQGRGPLIAFLQTHKKMAWRQIFIKPHGGGLGPLAQKFGIPGIPAMLLINRAGILQKARIGLAPTFLQKWVPRLLAEKIKK